MAVVPNNLPVQFWTTVGVDHSGWLWKRGDHFRTWRRRWFVLKGRKLFWFKDQEAATNQDSVPRGEVAVHRIISVQQAGSACPKPFAFELTGQDSTQTYVADSAGEMQAWLFKLQATVALYEAETFSARHFVRELSGYVLQTPLFEMGRRAPPAKSSFMCLDSQGKEFVLSLIAKPRDCPLTLSTDSSRASLCSLIMDLRHPYIWPTTQCEYVRSKERLMILRPYAKKGSLRDRICRCPPLESFSTKYPLTAKKRHGRPLSVSEIGTHGRQILEALEYLRARNIYGFHLHSGNVLMDKNCCYITDIVENEVLGLPVASARREQMDVMAFGRVLYEMATGILLFQDLPTLGTGTQCAAPVMAVLRSIFLPPQSGEVPSLADVMSQPLFAGVALVADVRFINQKGLDARQKKLVDKANDAGVCTEAELVEKLAELPSPPVDDKPPTADVVEKKSRKTSSRHLPAADVQAPAGTGGGRQERQKRKSRIKKAASRAGEEDAAGPIGKPEDGTSPSDLQSPQVDNSSATNLVAGYSSSSSTGSSGNSNLLSSLPTPLPVSQPPTALPPPPPVAAPPKAPVPAPQNGRSALLSDIRNASKLVTLRSVA